MSAGDRTSDFLARAPEGGFEEIIPSIDLPKSRLWITFCMPTNHPELPRVTVPVTISHFNFVLVQQPRDFFMAFFLRQLTKAAPIGVTNRTVGSLIQ